MKALLDTHVFLWLLTGDRRLSEKTRRVYLDPENSVYLSAASFWEIGIKTSLGKLSLHESWMAGFEEQMKKNAILWLPIAPLHCQRVSRLPFHHRDPFDRMLVAQALTENLVLLTADIRFKVYGVRCIF